MSARLNPYISFPGTAHEAMEFYAGVFGGELHVNTFGEYGMEGDGSEKIMHGMLETANGFTIMGADNPPGMDLTVGNNMAVSLSGDENALLTGYWEKLSDGGIVMMPLEKQMWGDVFGMCTDRFGVSWLVNIAGDAAG